ncbi:MAG: hypothetical protein J6T10_09785 [Methanobrevibacter sp.]|nr:hypothetical protein [Methanobrevibacter sp.]
MFILGIIIGYLICGIVILICNSLNIDEDIKEIILGWWLIPVIIPINKIIKRKKGE